MTMKKVGGIWFWRIGRLSLSASMSKPIADNYPVTRLEYALMGFLAFVLSFMAGAVA